MAHSKIEQQAHTRQALVEAAERAFSEGPIGEVTLAEVARNAGYTKGAIYSNFSSKNDLLLAVLERHMEIIPRDGVAGLLIEGFEWVTESRSRQEMSPGVVDASELMDGFATENLGYLRVVAALWSAGLDDPAVAERLAELLAGGRKGVQATAEAIANSVGVEIPIDTEELILGLSSMTLTLVMNSRFDPDINVGKVSATMFHLVRLGIAALMDAEAAADS